MNPIRSKLDNPVTWRVWLAWALPLMGHACFMLAFFGAYWLGSFILVAGLTAISALTLLAGLVAIVIVVRHSLWHGILGVGTLVFAGPLMFLLILFVAAPEARQDVARTWRKWRDNRAIAREYDGQPVAYEEVLLPTLPIPDPLVVGQQDDVWARVYVLDLPQDLRNPKIFWSASGKHVYLLSSFQDAQLWQIDASTRKVTGRVSLASYSTLESGNEIIDPKITSVGPVIHLKQDKVTHLLWFDESNLAQAKDIPRSTDYGVAMTTPNSSLVAMNRNMRMPVIDLSTMTLRARVSEEELHRDDLFGPPREPKIHRADFLAAEKRLELERKLNRFRNFGQQALQPQLQKLVPQEAGSNEYHVQTSPDGKKAIIHCGNAWLWSEFFPEPKLELHSPVP